MSDLRDWLKRAKLEALAVTLEANDIGLDILPELSEADLEKLGLTLGNRRRLLKALAEIPTEAPAAAPEPVGEAERRQVTVMFCDLVGSTALSGAIDPEHLGELIRRYQNAAAGAIGRYGGFVAKFMGDGILAYFGFPQAFEDAAERAVRASLAIVAEVQGIARPDGAKLQTRIGVATGLVVVGELIGAGASQERTIVGETPNLAARLQALAAPDQIMVAESTQHLVGGLFQLEASGPHELKGIAGPVTAWRVLAESEVESRFAAIRQADLPMIGRGHEMGLVLDRWTLARQGDGQFVTVIGEAGIGKSRIIDAVREHLVGEPHARINFQCSPYHSESALYPVIQYVARTAGFAAADPPEARRQKLAAIFPAAELPLAAELMSLPSEPAPVMTPAQRKAATVAMLIDMIVRRGETGPVLLIVEDAHWIDATTLELMTRLADAVGAASVLALITGRPEFAPPWGARPHATLLTLGRLGRGECAQLIAGVAAAHGLSTETVAAIVAKTDGVPLFAEELTKSVLEAAGEDSAAVPATLKDSLMARLDRLGEARDVAQIASVIGRQFSFGLLEAVAPKHDALDASLAKLVAAGIVFPEGRGIERGFAFKHALVRDAAYESLLLSRRREWHERIAHALEQRFPELAANEPELLAQHFGEAGLGARACDYRMLAGDRAAGRSAYREAIANFTAGLKAANTLPDAGDRMRRQLDFLLKLGPAQMISAGYQSAEVEDTYRRAAEIGDALADGHASYKAKWGLWLNANFKGKSALARDRAQELVALAERSGDGDLLLEAYHCRWSTSFMRGEVAQALDDSGIVAASYDIARHSHLGPAFGGHDPGVCAHAVHSMSLHLLGHSAPARESTARALALAERLDHPNTLAHALNTGCMLLQMAGDREATLLAGRRLAALAEKFGLLPALMSGVLMAAWASAVGSGIGEAARVFDAEIEKAVTVVPRPHQVLGLATEVFLAAGRPADALSFADQAIALIDEPGVGFYLPENYRLRGVCLLALDRNNKDEARDAFKTAKEFAERQGAVIFARRADDSLAGL
ncbi:MAG: adenylate/guanylate cyclase domain-containing protein [Stellaceae bacterium]